MAKAWLEVVDGLHLSYVAWFDEDDGEGARVGQDSETPINKLVAEQAKARGVRDEEGFAMFEYYSVEIAARKWVAEHGKHVAKIRSTYGYEFEAPAWARKFRAAMNAALKSARSEYDSNVPWPEWAKQAEAAGWKPPKGWKP
jgi:hypothetical protein